LKIIGEEITFSAIGDAKLYLSGNYLLDDVDEDMDDMDDEMMEDMEGMDDLEEDEEVSDIEDDGEDEGPEIFFNEEGVPVDADGNEIDISQCKFSFNHDDCIIFIPLRSQF
jgi:hypothetical protein